MSNSKFVKILASQNCLYFSFKKIMLQCLFYILFLFVYLNYADKFQENVLEQIIPIFPSISYKADDLRDIANNAYDDPVS